MENQDKKELKEWQAPQIIDLDAKNTEGGPTFTGAENTSSHS
jgi:hypothetical protein